MLVKINTSNLDESSLRKEIIDYIYKNENKIYKLKNEKANASCEYILDDEILITTSFDDDELIFVEQNKNIMSNISLDKLKELLCVNVNSIDFILSELIDWINTYEYEYAILDNKLIRKDLQDDGAETISFTISEFIYDWLITLENKKEDYLYSLNPNDRNEANIINNFLTLLNGLIEINKLLQKDESNNESV